MKKTINITLNGLVFSLEEDAYEKLKAYLDSIKNYYDSPEEEKEILSDIESSIAEKFSEKLKSKREAVSLADVEEIIKVMGTVEEITAAEETASDAKTENAKEEDTKEEINASKKKLYRNPDDVVIAGVASGVAAYFGLDPVFIRVLFVILAFANGLGVLIYLVLWLVMPMAVTGAQKLEMRGKPVNLSEIEQAVKEKSKMLGQEGRDAVSRLKQNNTFYKILNLPVKIIEAIFSALKKIVSLFFPLISIIIGFGITVGSTFAILGLSIASALMVFNINSPYIVSDFPLSELASAPLYYVGVISLYAVCVLPMIFLSALGITLIKRKNSFSLIGSSILIGAWMIAVVAGAVAAADLAPMIKTRVEEINKQTTAARSYDYKDFSKIVLNDQLNVKIVKGDKFAVNFTGRDSGLDRLEFSLADGELKISQKLRETKGLCVFCFSDNLSGEITMPELNSLDVTMNDQANLTANDLAVAKVALVLNDFSRVNLTGQTKELIVKAKDFSSLKAEDLAAGTVSIEATDFSRAEVWTKEKLNAIASDKADIIYKGEPKNLIKSAADFSRIEKFKADDDLSENKIFIITDAKQYSPIMSSIRGIGLTPEYVTSSDGQSITYHWQTNQGALIENWDNLKYLKEVSTSDASQKIFWTYLPGYAEINRDEPIYVYLEAQGDGGEILNSTQIEFEANGQGLVTQKVNK